MQHDFDILIRGGTIVDGSGKPAFTGDVAIRGDRIAAVAPEIAGTATREIDATGKLVTPGFVDIHTHYDGQLIWSERMSPSSNHGVTTVMTGNCGIGFAPCRREDHMALIQLMEGVEDIPEPVTSAGLTWDWETFPQFLDAVESQPHDIDVVALLPHSPLRVYVMGERAINREAATPEDIAKMKTLVAEALDAGAIGLGTSRMPQHRSSTGEQIPTMGAQEDEMLAFADVMREKGKGVFQLVSLMQPEHLANEVRFMSDFSERSGRTVTYTQAQTHPGAEPIAAILDGLARANDRPGVNIKAQLYPRPIGLVIGLRATVNPFCMAPLWEELKDLPLEQKVAEMRKPEVRDRLLHDAPLDPANPLFNQSRKFTNIFEFDPETPEYEQAPERSIAARAKEAGVTPEELFYDLLLKDEGHALFFAAMGNYADFNLDFMSRMLRDDNVVIGLGDGGAHYGMVCDASYPTFALTHWVRDRGHDRFGLEEMVHLLARKPAETVGLTDRGLLAEGKLASVNVIDHENLALFTPEIVHDLPGGGRRLHQRARGYVATIVNGVVIAENDQPTGATPGRLLRDTPVGANDDYAMEAAE